ncbi:MAG: phosphatase PAP2 family protein [archaeon]|nr:phosphatase PAP2 family protein [archaeon]
MEKIIPPPKHQKKMFYVAALTSSAYSLYMLVYYNKDVFYGIGIGIITTTLLLLSEKIISPTHWKAIEVLKLCVFFSLIFHLVCFYRNASNICYKAKKYDEYFLNADDFLLGWFLPKGQFALFFDQSELMNPTTDFGIFLNSFLVIFYSIYFATPVLCVLGQPLFTVIWEIKYRFKHNGEYSPSYNHSWRDLYFMAATYIFSYLPVIFVNLLFPAWSPRIYIKDLYKTEITYFGIIRYLNVCKEHSANSFPSGHLAETLCFAFSLHVIGYNKLKYFALITAFMIFWSTLLLRKHYFVDLLASAVIALFAFSLPYFFGYKKDQKEMKENPNLISIANSINNTPSEPKENNTTELSYVEVPNGKTSSDVEKKGSKGNTVLTEEETA